MALDAINDTLNNTELEFAKASKIIYQLEETCAKKHEEVIKI